MVNRSVLSRRAVLGRTLALGVAPFAVAALGRPGTTAAQSAPTGEIIVSLGEPDTLLSGAIQSAVGGNIMRFIANGLAKLGQPSMDAEPDLASAWEVSEDGTTYTFTLHDGVRWQDGQPFSADDVIFSYGLWAHPEWPGPIDPNLSVIAGADEYKAGSAPTISGIEVVDPATVRFTLTAPTPSFLANAATFQLLPKHILENVPPADAAKDPFATKPIYTGPFQVEEWKQGEGITFRAFSDSFAGAPKLDAIITRTIPDPATLVADLQTGGVNLAFVTPDQYETFKSDAAYQTAEIAGVAGWFFAFDTNLPFFSDPNVRKAISHAIDRQTIIDTLLLGRAEPGHSVASPLSWIYNPDVPKFEYDVDQANALLDAAGWVTGSNGVRAKDGQDFTFKLNLTARTRDWAVAVQPYLGGGRDQVRDQRAGIRYLDRAKRSRQTPGVAQRLVQLHRRSAGRSPEPFRKPAAVRCDRLQRRRGQRALPAGPRCPHARRGKASFTTRSRSSLKVPPCTPTSGARRTSSSSAVTSPCRPSRRKASSSRALRNGA